MYRLSTRSIRSPRSPRVVSPRALLLASSLASLLSACERSAETGFDIFTFDPRVVGAHPQSDLGSHGVTNHLRSNLALILQNLRQGTVSDQPYRLDNSNVSTVVLGPDVDAVTAVAKRIVPVPGVPGDQDVLVLTGYDPDGDGQSLLRRRGIRLYVLRILGIIQDIGLETVAEASDNFYPAFVYNVNSGLCYLFDYAAGIPDAVFDGEDCLSLMAEAVYVIDTADQLSPPEERLHVCGSDFVRFVAPNYCSGMVF